MGKNQGFKKEGTVLTIEKASRVQKRRYSINDWERKKVLTYREMIDGSKNYYCRIDKKINSSQKT